MRFTTKTEYGLVCLIYIAKHSEKSLDPISIKEMATAEGFSTTYIEKILQSLRAAKILVSHQGNQGGYALAKAPSQITLKEVIEALEGATFDVFCEPEVRKDITCTHFSLCGIKPLWGKTKEILDQFYSSLTLEMLMNNTLGAVKI
jgi:Rrf2 family transcriptional regulator, iron-sulfur cluster assembly transcription factor